MAITPEDTIDKISDNIVKVRSLIVGKVNQQAVHHWQANITNDEAAKFMNKFSE